MGNLRLDKLLIVDIEKTCWMGEPQIGERSEIIEIGITEVELWGEPRVGKSRSYLVQPINSRVSEYCTNLTSITPRMLAKQGRRFPEVCNSIRKEFGGSAKTWAAWGRDDQDIEVECRLQNVISPFSSSYLDLGQTWGLLAGATRSIGLMGALESWNIKFQGTHHRGVDDSYNLARLYVEMVKYNRCFAQHLSKLSNARNEITEEQNEEEIINIKP